MKNLIKCFLDYILDEGDRLSIEYAPCADGYHTSYQLLRERRKKTFVAFPQQNFQLTTPEWQEETRRQMAEQGFRLSLQ